MTEAQDLNELGDDSPTPHISQLRVVIEVQDWDLALRFYRDALGLDQLHGYKNDDGAQLVLDAGRATIELVHPELRSDGDGPSALNAPPAPRVRLAFQTDDAKQTITELETAGARQVTPARVAAPSTINARLVGPDDMPLSIFQPLSGPDFAEPPTL